MKLLEASATIMLLLTLVFGLLAGIVGIWLDVAIGKKLILTAADFFLAALFTLSLCMGFKE